MALRLSPRHARRLSMTSLIDVIFLLLLFFMLSSTFSRFGTVDLMTTGQGQGISAQSKPLFLQIDAERLTLNGEPIGLELLVARMMALAPGGDEDNGAVQLLLSLAPEVTAQRLVDVLSILRQQPRFAVTVLG